MTFEITEDILAVKLFILKENRMCYLPAIVIAVGVAVAVALAVYITKDAGYLWGLAAMFFVNLAMPSKDN